MTWALYISRPLERDYQNLCAKDAALRRAVDKKVDQILLQPTHYKPLRAPLQGVRRVQVAGPLVLLFEADEPAKVVRLLRLAHHDEAYGR